MFTDRNESAMTDELPPRKPIIVQLFALPFNIVAFLFVGVPMTLLRFLGKSVKVIHAFLSEKTKLFP